ncbi:HD domain-containing phosphohydrolase [Desulfuromonas thiophila]|uniref:GAF domain-containing protein n=1 Tax=Desulfuromonas thiophila TaxID=57664 RepID=A0A1G7AF53_9BACT|nr:HD domain-containing phosphohydrolase [Desulfuromonas thiophila]SDE13313.1 GAF domain-containing protein [Desulfuromonas thiophila]
MHLLLIEDNPGDARLIQELLIDELGRGGFEFVSATTLKQGLELAGQINPDLILLDLTLPDSDGLDSVRQTVSACPQLAIIVLTGVSNQEIATQSLRMGVQDYLNKGEFDGNGLCRAIWHAIERKQLLRQLHEHEEEISRSKTLLETIVNSNADGLIVLGQDRQILFFNPAAEAILSPQRLELGNELNGLTIGTTPAQKLEWTPPGQANRFLDIRQTPIVWKHRAANLISVRDMTEKEQLQYKLNLQVQMLTTIHQGAQNLMAEFDLETMGQQLAKSCVTDFGADAAWLMWIDDQGHHYGLAAYPKDDALECPYYTDTSLYERIPDQCPTAQAITERTPKLVALGQETQQACLCGRRQRQGWSSVGAFPLLGRNRVQGCLTLFSYQADFFVTERVNFFQSYVHLAAASLENAQLFKQTATHLKHFEALRSIDMAITSSMDMRLTLDVILGYVQRELNCDACAILLCSQGCGLLSYTAGKGFSTSGLQHFTVTAGQGVAGTVAKSRQLVSIPDLMRTDMQIVRLPQLQNERIRAYHGIPLMAKGRVLGVLEIFHRHTFEPSQEWRDFLQALATQTAIAIDNIALIHDLEKAHSNLFASYEETIEGWARALDYRDRETEGHSRRVTDMTVMMAREVGIDIDEIMHVRRGALLHDIGKLGVPDNILRKPGPLTEDEWIVMKRHPQIAYELISPIEYLRPAIRIPYCHHEKWDGSGYPRGLKGKQIPLEARIFAIIDVYDALRSDRPYRPGWPEEKVRNYLREESGHHFDPDLVERFLRIDFGTLDDVPGVSSEQAPLVEM